MVLVRGKSFVHLKIILSQRLKELAHVLPEAVQIHFEKLSVTGK